MKKVGKIVLFLKKILVSILFQVGMRAVCSGPDEGCARVSLENCVVTPLSSDCYKHMSDLKGRVKKLFILLGVVDEGIQVH